MVPGGGGSTPLTSAIQWLKPAVSKQRTEFALIGDLVNVPSRVCEAGETLQTDFVISADFYNQITPVEPMTKVEAFENRGRKKPIDLLIIASTP